MPRDLSICNAVKGCVFGQKEKRKTQAALGNGQWKVFL